MLEMPSDVNNGDNDTLRLFILTSHKNKNEKNNKCIARTKTKSDPITFDCVFLLFFYFFSRIENAKHKKPIE